jgi:DNA-binding transcriptional MerR regulator
MLVRYRVDDLAARAGVTVDTVRYYQSRRLLPPPQREGRIGWYGEDHLERLRRIRYLKDHGFSLASIERHLAGDLEPADAALVDALAGPLPDEEGAGELLTRAQLAERTGVSEALMEAIEREGLLIARAGGADGEPRYSTADADTVSAGLALLEAGVPLGELLDLARRYDEAMRGIAEHAVELFIRFVRDPIHGSAASEREASERLVTAFRTMLPATSLMVARHFRRLLLASAQARIEGDGEAEGAAARDAQPADERG